MASPLPPTPGKVFRRLPGELRRNLVAEVFRRRSGGGLEEARRSPGREVREARRASGRRPGEVGRRRPGEVGRRPGRRPGGGQEEAGEASREEPKEDSREEPGGGQSVVNSSKSEGGWQFVRESSATAPQPSGRMGSKLGLLLESEDLGGALVY